MIRLMNSGEGGLSNMLNISNDNKSSIRTQNHVMSQESAGSLRSKTRFLKNKIKKATSTSKKSEFTKFRRPLRRSTKENMTISPLEIIREQERHQIQDQKNTKSPK